MSALERVVLVMFVVATAGVPAAAQRAQGILRDSTTGERVAGGVVAVTDSAGRLLARTISDSAGRFAVMRLAGSARLSVIRIGYLPRDVPLGPLDTGITVSMRSVPALLSTVTAKGRRVCPGDKDGGQALELWEQARAALLAGLLARQLNSPRISLISFTRDREPIRRRIEEETHEAKFVVADRSYVAARPAWAFAEHGYMREEMGGERTYFAPDESVLLDETFAGTHCMHVVAGAREHGDDVGIGFEPVELDGRDTLVDIKGVLWMDRKTPALRSLEFDYTGLEPAARGSGGRLEFRLMPSGAPLILRWSIHSTVLATDVELLPNGVVRRLRPRSDRTNVRVLGYHEVGGEVSSAQWSDGSSWRGPFPRAVGTVVDEGGNAVRGARVWIGGEHGSDTATTRADGSFDFPPMMPGFYFVHAADSVFAEHGVARAMQPPIQLSSRDVALTIRLRSREDVLAAVCAQQVHERGSAVVVGRLVGDDGEPVEGVRVDASWHADTSRTETTRSAKTNDNGRYVICGVRRNVPIRVRASANRLTADEQIQSITDELTSLKLVLKPRAD